MHKNNKATVRFPLPLLQLTGPSVFFRERGPLFVASKQRRRMLPISSDMENSLSQWEHL
jgi:hypothetical protein